MDTMNSRNSKSSGARKLLLNLKDKVNLKRRDKYVDLSNLNIHYAWANMKKSYKKNKFKISAPLWNEEFKLSNVSNSVSDIEDYFQYIIKNHKTSTDDAPVKAYLNNLYYKIII